MRGRRAPIEWARRYEGVPATLRLVRAEIVHSLEGLAASDDLCERAALVVGELAANAVQASPGRTYDVALRVDDAGVVIAVTNRVDDGEGPPPCGTWATPDPASAHGRGLAIVAALADRVEVTRPDPTTVVVTARLTREDTV